MLFQCVFWHLRKGVKNHFTASFLLFAFRVVSPLFSTLLLTGVFLKPSSSSIPIYANVRITAVPPFQRPPSPCPAGTLGSFPLSDRGRRACRAQPNTDRFCCPLPTNTSPIFKHHTGLFRDRTACAPLNFMIIFFLLRQISFHSIPPPSILSLVGTKVVCSTFC